MKRNAEDLTGKEFGMLTVVEPTDLRENRYQVWRCRCRCGGEISVSSRRLKRRNITDCGCVPGRTSRNGTKAEDLSGQVFGKLTVLGRADNRNGRTAWTCRCVCGNETIVTAHELKNGHTRSCGCLRRRNLKNCRNLTGQRYGRLEAMYPTSRRDRKGSVYWHCRCDCGNEAEYTEDVLVHGSHKSCGCLRRELWAAMENKCTLVDGTCIEVLEKRKYRKDNTSGFRGVSDRGNGRFAVTIGFKKRRFCVGTYYSFEEAVAARLEAERLVHDGFLEAYRWWKRQDEEHPGWGGGHPLSYEVDKINGDICVSTNYGELKKGAAENTI